MRSRAIFAAALGLPLLGLAAAPAARVWDDAAIASLELPLLNAAASPQHVRADFYYRMAVLPIYRSYPVYGPGKEPPGYQQWLAKQEPAIVFDTTKLRTEADWLKAGALVFDAPIAYDFTNTVADVRDPAWYEKIQPPLAKDGSLPFYRYVVRKKGVVELGNLACATCHTRVLADGTVVRGAQGNFPFARAQGLVVRTRVPIEGVRASAVGLYGAPWIRPDPASVVQQMTVEQVAAALEAIPPGVVDRQGTSFDTPAQVSDLIGVKDLRYLDHTGLVQHRDAADLMRYAALNQGLDFMARYGDFLPNGTLPDPATEERYSDEQLDALVRYLYSLAPPRNPNPSDAKAARGEEIFEAQGCGLCHRPPLYTNNMLTPVAGFEVPDAHLDRYDVLINVVGTDPGLATRTRRGTGYYKVPSLRGVWYRGPLEHSGSVGTLEEWFDAARLTPTFRSTGFRGAGVEARAVKGHAFGLGLAKDDREALIAFLRTL